MDFWGKKSGAQINSRTKTLKTLLGRELRNHLSRKGSGQPEELKNNFPGYWSRRITPKARLVYSMDDETMEVIIYMAKGHYSDK